MIGPESKYDKEGPHCYSSSPCSHALSNSIWSFGEGSDLDPYSIGLSA